MMKILAVFLTFFVGEICCSQQNYCVIGNARMYDEKSYVSYATPCQRRYCNLGSTIFVRIMTCESVGAPKCRDPNQEGNTFPKCCTEKPLCTPEELQEMRMREQNEKIQEVREKLFKQN
uniref:Single domain-containing protein n=1 Tax=Amblyomma triste TaxID=251400 RepID=A0A023G8C4_AMBTT